MTYLLTRFVVIVHFALESLKNKVVLLLKLRLEEDNAKQYYFLIQTLFCPHIVRKLN